jgi:hypothetical protein
MSVADFLEWMTVLVMIPVGTFAFVFWVATAIFVYFDAKVRSKSRIFAVGLAIAGALSYWPLSYLTYFVCTIVIDRSRIRRKTA